jgi:hypothetical protein
MGRLCQGLSRARKAVRFPSNLTMRPNGVAILDHNSSLWGYSAKVSDSRSYLKMADNFFFFVVFPFKKQILYFSIKIKIKQQKINQFYL